MPLDIEEAALKMRMDRNWIVLVLAVLLIASVGCSKKPPEVEPPPVDTAPTPPPQDVVDKPAPAPAADQTAEKRPESIEELEERLRTQGLIGDVFFEFDKYDLGEEARQRLAKNAEFMSSDEGRNLTFKIEGHCDERGTNEYNLALGENRSAAALDYLASLGVPRNRFQILSFGEERPFCTESTEACWQKNRRARFVITGN